MQPGAQGIGISILSTPTAADPSNGTGRSDQLIPGVSKNEQAVAMDEEIEVGRLP